MMKYRMVAIDLDGTLLDSDAQPHPAAVEAIERAENAGLLVVLCTGRGLCESAHAVDAINHSVPMVTLSGARICDPVTGQTLHAWPIHATLAAQLSETLAEQGLATLLYTDDPQTGCDYRVIGSDKLIPETRAWLEQSFIRVDFQDQPNKHAFDHVLRIGTTGSEPAVQKACDQWQVQFADHVDVHMMHFKASITEAFAKGVNKWTALKWLAKHHDIDPKQVAAIGDDVNDLAMITHAGCGIAMNNAVEPIKQVAQQITRRSNNAGGVAEALDHLIQGRW